MNKRFIAAVLGAAALAIPAAAVANPGHGKGHEKNAAKKVVKGKGKGKKPKTVTFVFRGTFTAPGTVEVVSGNAHVRKGGFVGQQVEFDFAGAKVVVADTNADLAVDINDVKDGDSVLVQARILKGTQHAAAAEDGAEAADAVVAARKLVDETNAPVETEPEPETEPVS
jgi:hypothetical protein